MWGAAGLGQRARVELVVAYSGEREISDGGRRALCCVALIGAALAGACGGESRRTLDASPVVSATVTSPSSPDSSASSPDPPPKPTATQSAPASPATSSPSCAPPASPSPDCPAELFINVDPRVTDASV